MRRAQEPRRGIDDEREHETEREFPETREHKQDNRGRERRGEPGPQQTWCGGDVAVARHLAVRHGQKRRQLGDSRLYLGEAARAQAGAAVASRRDEREGFLRRRGFGGPAPHCGFATKRRCLVE